MIEKIDVREEGNTLSIEVIEKLNMLIGEVNELLKKDDLTALMRSARGSSRYVPAYDDEVE